MDNHTRIEGCANSTARVRARRILPPLYRRNDSDNQPSAHPSRRSEERTATRAMTGLMSHWATTGGIIERCVHYYRSLFGNRSAERMKLVAITCRYSVRRSVAAYRQTWRLYTRLESFAPISKPMPNVVCSLRGQTTAVAFLAYVMQSNYGAFEPSPVRVKLFKIKSS